MPTPVQVPAQHLLRVWYHDIIEDSVRDGGWNSNDGGTSSTFDICTITSMYHKLLSNNGNMGRQINIEIAQFLILHVK